MTTTYIPTLTVKQVYERMSALGIKTTPQKIMAMIDAGKYPWAVSCVMKERSYEIYAVLFEQWLSERMQTVDEDELFDWGDEKENEGGQTS